MNGYKCRKQIFNNKYQKPVRSELRNNQTEPEKIFWNWVRNKQFGVKFRRQYGIGRYIVDFYCPELKLVIEIDGDSHFDEISKEYDAKWDEYLFSIGLKIMRFTNTDLMQNREGVLLKLLELIPGQTPP